MILPICLIVVGFLLLLIGAWMLLVAAYKESLVWMLCCLFVPGAKFLFCILHWEVAKSGIISYVLGISLLAMGAVNVNGQLSMGSLPQTGGRSEVGSAHAAPATTQLFEQKQQKLGEINQMMCDVTALESQVARDYLQLSERRKTLQTSDQMAVQGFNVAAAFYAKANADLADKKAEFNRLWKELEILTNESERQAREQSVKVVLYTTAWCPACKQAKAYMAQNGIAYREMDVENSPQAAQEFAQFGGGGVPLVVVNGHRMTGFDPDWIQQMLAQN